MILPCGLLEAVLRPLFPAVALGFSVLISVFSRKVQFRRRAGKHEGEQRERSIDMLGKRERRCLKREKIYHEWVN